jgi:hypothetical protein
LIHWDRYFVLIYTGRGTEWLEGDEELGYPSEEGGGDIWFSDLARALNARDEYRGRRPSMKWLPDREL